MTISVFTVLVLLAGLFSNAAWTVRWLVVFSLFGAASAIGLPALGGATITPALLLLPFVVVRAAQAALRDEQPFELSRVSLWLLLLVVWGVASAIVMPHVFYGDTQVFVLDRLSGRGERLYPLKPLPTNLTQSVYAVGQFTCFVAVQTLLRTPNNLLRFRDTVLFVAYLNAFAAALNLAEYAGMPSLLDYVRTAEGYSLAIEYAMGGLPRLHGTFSEASFFAYYTLPLFAFCLNLWTAGIRPYYSGIATMLSLGFLLLSTSGTAYMGLLAYGGLYAIRTLHTGRVPVPLALAFGFGVAGVLALYAFDLDAAKPLNQFVQATILDKASSGSGEQRSAWNVQAWTNFLETYGLGAGLGSARASSHPLVLLSNLGVVGTLLFLAFAVSIVRASRKQSGESELESVRRAAGDAFVATIVGSVLAVGMFDLGITFYLFAAAASAGSYRRSLVLGARDGLGMRSASVALAALVMVGVVGMVGAASTARAEAPPRSYDRLPPAVRAQLLTGTPRSTSQIADSPFGTHTTVCAEGAPGEYIDRAPRLISEAGYKWVVEYVRLPTRQRHAPSGDHDDPADLSPRCVDYVRRLHGFGFKVLMRLDAVPRTKLIGESPLEPADLQLAAAFTRRVVAQLKPYIHDWQIGNEPNIGNAPHAYVSLAAVVAKAVRAEQSDAVVYGPAVAMLQCLSDQPFPWIQRALELGLLQHIDAFSFHPYRANGDTPEQASEFARWRKWPSYYAQISSLRDALRASHGGADIRLATTEDGESSAVSDAGEQRITWTIDAKNELRRSLQDLWLGVYPRTQFAFFRNIDDAFYSVEGSFNTITRGLEKKPIYYAAQNLHAVVDSSYARATDIRVSVSPQAATDKLGALGVYVQTYTKQQRGFTELLVFYWSTVPATSIHLRIPVQLEVQGGGWEAPLLIDLMTMPGKARSVGHEPSNHRRVEVLQARRTNAGLAIDGAELRDYPQLIKLVRVARSR